MRENASSAGNQQETLLKSKGSSETTRQISQKNLAILLAFLFTDGCVSAREKHSWRIYFASTSQHLLELFTECITSAFRLEKSRVHIRYRKDGTAAAIVDSKEIGNYLVTTFGGFRTLRFANGELPAAQLPISFLHDNGYIRHFLQAAFTCDGGLCLYPARREGSRGGTQWLIRTVFLACAHPNLRKDYMYLLSALGITAREVAADGKIKIETEKNIRRFAAKVGFVPGVQVTANSKYWRGQEKQRVLELMIASYANPASLYRSPIFTSR